MASWIFIAVAVLLFGVTLRQWLEYGQRQRQLAAEIHRLGNLVTAHQEKLERVRTATKRLENETSSLVDRRQQLQSDVVAQREKLTDLEERLERIRPKSHRVDSKPRSDGENDWI